jgi:hypothetical protein
MTFMNNNIPDARTRFLRLGQNVQDQYIFGGNNPGSMGRSPQFKAYGGFLSGPMDRAMETQAPNNAVTMAQQSAAGRAFGDNMSRQMSVDPNITSRIF